MDPVSFRGMSPRPPLEILKELAAEALPAGREEDELLESGGNAGGLLPAAVQVVGGAVTVAAPAVTQQMQLAASGQILLDASTVLTILSSSPSFAASAASLEAAVVPALSSSLEAVAALQGNAPGTNLVGHPPKCRGGLLLALPLFLLLHLPRLGLPSVMRPSSPLPFVTAMQPALQLLSPALKLLAALPAVVLRQLAVGLLSASDQLAVSQQHLAGAAAAQGSLLASQMSIPAVSLSRTPGPEALQQQQQQGQGIVEVQRAPLASATGPMTSQLMLASGAARPTVARRDPHLPASSQPIPVDSAHSVPPGGLSGRHQTHELSTRHESLTAKSQLLPWCRHGGSGGEHAAPGAAADARL